MDRNNKYKNILLSAFQTMTALSILSSLFVGCQKENLAEELHKGSKDLGKPAFTLDLNLGGGVDTEMPGEVYSPLELDKTDDELRAAGINLKREGSTDGSSRKFKVEIDVASGRDLPVVVACRITQGDSKRMFLGQATLQLSGANNRSFRIQQSGIKFHEVNKNSEIIQSSAELPDASKANYEIKLFVGGTLQEATDFDKVTRYTIGYGMNETNNRATLYVTDSNGAVTFNNIGGKIPFTSQWAKVLYGRNAKGEGGVSNNHADQISGLERLRLKADGSILMFSISNEMTDPTIELQNVRLYSERLTKNVAYVFDGTDLMARPAAFVKGATNEEAWYLNAELTNPNISLKPKVGDRVESRSFFLWAKQLGTDYLDENQWTPTSVVAQIKETRKDGKIYWYNMPLLKTYDPLTKVHNGRIAKVALKFEDGMPVHPMNFFAKTYIWHTDGYSYSTDIGASWRTGFAPASSALYGGWTKNTIYGIETKGWDESYYLYFNSSKATHWKWHDITGNALPFGKVNPDDAFNNFLGTERSYYIWKVPGIWQLSALFPIGMNQEEINKTNSTSVTFIREKAVVLPDGEGDPDSDFYSILQRKGHITYAIRFLRKTSRGYYMTPYTAAYRYTRNWPEWWKNDRAEYWTQDGRSTGNQIDIRMRLLGGSTHQYNEHDGQSGYYSPIFNETRLRELFKIVTEESRTHPDWWNTNPLRGDDIVRIYPALGMQKNYAGDIWWVANHVCVGSIDGSSNRWNILKFGYEDDYKFDWYSNTDQAPLIMYAERKEK